MFNVHAKITFEVRERVNEEYMNDPSTFKKYQKMTKEELIDVFSDSTDMQILPETIEISVLEAS